MPEPLVRPSTISDEIAIEKGRLLAAQNLANDPERRELCLKMFGLDQCKRMWPEVYDPSPFRTRIVDKIKFLRW